MVEPHYEDHSQAPGPLPPPSQQFWLWFCHTCLRIPRRTSPVSFPSRRSRRRPSVSTCRDPRPPRPNPWTALRIFISGSWWPLAGRHHRRQSRVALPLTSRRLPRPRPSRRLLRPRPPRRLLRSRPSRRLLRSRPSRRLPSGHGPPAVSFGHGPPAVSFGHGPPAVSFGHGPPAVSFGHDPPAVSFGHDPHAVSFGHDPHAVSLGHDPHDLTICHSPTHRHRRTHRRAPAVVWRNYLASSTRHVAPRSLFVRTSGHSCGPREDA